MGSHILGKNYFLAGWVCRVINWVTLCEGRCRYFLLMSVTYMFCPTQCKVHLSLPSCSQASVHLGITGFSMCNTKLALGARVGGSMLLESRKGGLLAEAQNQNLARVNTQLFFFPTTFLSTISGAGILIWADSAGFFFLNEQVYSSSIPIYTHTIEIMQVSCSLCMREFFSGQWYKQLHSN